MKLEFYNFQTVDSPLSKYKRNVTSQSGEDGIIARILELIQPPNRFCVEFGAWDGIKHSNCYNLIKNCGWGGVLIEADGKKYEELAKTYEDTPQATTVNRLVAFEGSHALDNILDEFSAPTEIGVLSIDVDGNDYYIWESLTRHSAEVVVIEFNPTVPNDVLFVQDKSLEVNQGCSLLALIMLGKDKGYELAACTDYNALFVKRDKLEVLGVKSNFITSMFVPQQDGRIFQGYDGTVHVVGMTRLIWKGGEPGIPVTSEDFQVLPKSMRFWKGTPNR